MPKQSFTKLATSNLSTPQILLELLPKFGSISKISIKFQFLLSKQTDLPNLFFHRVSTLMASRSLTSNDNVWGIDQTKLSLA